MPELKIKLSEYAKFVITVDFSLLLKSKFLQNYRVIYSAVPQFNVFILEVLSILERQTLLVAVELW